MSENVCSEPVEGRLDGLGPTELLALARAAVGRCVDAGADAGGLLGLARAAVTGGAAAGGSAQGLLAVAGEAVGRAVEQPLEDADDGALVASVEACHRVESRVHAEKLRRAAAVERQGAYAGRARTSVNLWVARLGVSRGEARMLVDGALALQRLPHAAAAHAAGRLGSGHVADATRTVAQLETLETDASTGGRAGAGRVEQAVAELDRLIAEHTGELSGEPADTDAKAGEAGGESGGGAGEAAGGDGGRPVGRQVLRQRLEEFEQQAAPELLAERERRLRARRSLHLTVDRRDADGQPRLEAGLAPVTYAKARAMIHALARQHPAADPRSFAQRCHDAFDRILDLAAATGQLPDTAGDQPRVLLLVHADTLHERPGAPAARLDGYGPLSAATARQVCCDAEVTTVAQGEGGQILNVGRDRRQPNRAQRRAAFARDGGCVGCGAPLAFCQIHHVLAWEDGGGTDIDNLVAVCWDCHTNIHHHGWQVTRDPGGRYRLQPPAWAIREPDRRAS